MDAIYAYGLSKQYGNKTALHNLTFHVPEGSKYAIVGSEGCGKTTALRLFSALTLPSIGECKIFGHSSQYNPEKVHAVTGVVTETAQLYENMTVRENLQFFAGLYKMDNYETVDRLSFLLHKLDIWETRDSFIRQLPTNALQRVHLARALMHYPKLLLMDEPTEGMDLDTLEVVNGLLEHLNTQEDVTILFCTRHYLHAQKFCNEFAMMESGVVSAAGDMESLRKRCGLFYHAKLILSPNSVRPPSEFIQQEDGSWYTNIESETEMPKLITHVLESGCELYEALIEKPTLIDVYKQLFRFGAEGSAFFVNEIQPQQQTEPGDNERTKEEAERKEGNISEEQSAEIFTEEEQLAEENDSGGESAVECDEPGEPAKESKSGETEVNSEAQNLVID